MTSFLTDLKTRLADVKTRPADVNTRPADVKTRLADVKTRLAACTLVFVIVGSVAALAPGTAAAAVSVTWSTPTAANAGALTAAACAPDASTCAAVSQTGNFVAIPSNSTPSPPVDIDSGTALTAISCPTTTACAVGDADGNVLQITSAGTSKTSLATDGAITAISCPTSTFCAATDADGSVFIFNGVAWSAPTSLTSAANALDGVSCANAGFCQAVDLAGDTFIFGGTWSPGESLGSGVTGISCPTTQFCDAVTQAADGSPAATYAYSGMRELDEGLGFSPWGADSNGFPTLTSFDAVACPSANFCDLGGATGVESSDSPDPMDITQSTQWVQSSTDPNVTAVACANSTYCVAVDSAGNVMTADGPPQNVTLPSISASIAADSTVTANPGTWLGITGAYTYQWISCASAGGPCGVVAGATGQTFSTTVGAYLEVEVTGSNAQGSSTVYSPITGPITATPVAPANTAVPSISGTAAVGQTLTGNVGTFIGTAPITDTEQWYACATRCAAITGATGGTLVVTAAEIGERILLVVTATNVAGTAAPVASALTAAVPALIPPALTTPATTRAMLATWLSPLLHLSGTPGRLTRIRKAKGYTATFKAAIPGTVKITWTITEKIAHSKKTRTVTVASANAKTKAPSTQLKITLTPTGVKLLKNLKREKVKATVTFTYADSTGTPSYKATRVLTLSR